jgi:hypothetical protein
MNIVIRVAISPIAAIALLAAGPLLTLAFPVPAMAQAAGMAGIGGSETLSALATVKTVDLQTRTVTLIGPQGNTLTLKVSDQVTNLPNVKPADKVKVSYFTSIAYVLAPPGTKLPDDSLTVAGTRAAPGQMPAGAAGTRIVVTGLVVGVDPVSYRVDLVNPSGGMVHSIAVVTAEGRQNLKLIKAGDTITAVISEAIAVAVEPAS